MRKCYLLLFALVLFTTSGFAQLARTKNIPGNYPGLASTHIDIRTSGISEGSVMLHIFARNSKTTL